MLKFSKGQEGTLGAAHRDLWDELWTLVQQRDGQTILLYTPAHREESIEMLEATAEFKGENGFGFKERPARGL